MTATSICNGALQKLGEPPIQSLDDETKRARACKSSFDKLRKSLLRLYPWNFATVRTTLAASTTPPPFEFTHSCPLPADYLRLVQVYNYDYPYRVESGNLLCETDSPQIKYVRDQKDLTQADALFVDSFEWYLASNICRYLNENSKVREEAQLGFRRLIAYAKFVQSTENSQQELESNDLIEARINPIP